MENNKISKNHQTRFALSVNEKSRKEFYCRIISEFQLFCHQFQIGVIWNLFWIIIWYKTKTCLHFQSYDTDLVKYFFFRTNSYKNLTYDVITRVCIWLQEI